MTITLATTANFIHKTFRSLPLAIFGTLSFPDFYACTWAQKTCRKDSLSDMGASAMARQSLSTSWLAPHVCDGFFVNEDSRRTN